MIQDIEPSDFDAAFARLLGHEGGYVADSRDPGGETNWGISKRAYPGEDIKGLTQERAKQIYRRDYWQRAGCELLPAALRFDVFDMAVNSGVAAAIKMVQRAVGVSADGALGPVTRAAVAAVAQQDAQALRMRMAGARLAMMTDLPTWPAFGRGWARRIAANLMEA